MSSTAPQAEKLRKLISAANKILITSHISPDPDAVSSVLLLGTTLQENYPDKKIIIALEEAPLSDLSFLDGYSQLMFKPIFHRLKDLEPDLFIIVDANTFNRISRMDAEQIRSYVDTNKTKTAIIDHHEFEGRENSDIFINNKRPATAEEIYALCFEQLNLKKPQGFAETTLLGIISDTQRHRFDHPGYRETYRIVADLLDNGASIEKLESRLEHYTKDEMRAFSHLAQNMTDSGKGYSYTFIDNDFITNWQNESKSAADLKNAVEFFTSKFIRNFENNTWGFVIYPDIVEGAGCWGISFRGLSDAQDVSAIARQLGGGGHKPAAGAKIKASNVEDVLLIVEDAIKKVRKS